jgi:futalosine hydrolase
MSRKILLVAATAFEIQPALELYGCTERWARSLGVAGTRLKTQVCDVLISGVGQLQSAVHITSCVISHQYDLVLQAGLAGSFSPQYPKCSVVSVSHEVLADFGAESDSGYLDIIDMGLLAVGQPPFTEGELQNPHCELLDQTGLPIVRSATVNRTLSDPRSIGWIAGRYRPDVVNMEGAALFHACLTLGVPFLELRAVSDLVGPRDKAAWDIPGAIKVLNEHLVRVVDTLASEGTSE